MKKIPSLFKRDYKGNRLVYDEVVEGCEWVIEGEGKATEKYDGTACAIIDGVFYKRYDVKKGRTVPENAISCEPRPNQQTGHWPHWVPVTDAKADQWHRKSYNPNLFDGTYELVGPKVQRNPYQFERHLLLAHGYAELDFVFTALSVQGAFNEVRQYLEGNLLIEGIVWHRFNGEMCKIKRKDFGLPWPLK